MNNVADEQGRIAKVRFDKPSPAPAAPPAPPAQRRVPVEMLATTPTPAAVAKAGFATMDQFYDAVAAQFRLARVALDSIELSLELAVLIPEAVASKHRFVPVFASAEEVSIAVTDPTQLQLFDWLGRQLKRQVTVVVATPTEIERARSRLYETRKAPAFDATVSEQDIAAASGLVNTIIAGAIDQHASDIHIEASEHETIVRFRVDGVLRIVETRPIEQHAPIVSRIKVLAGLDIAIHHVPQDGRIKLPAAAGDTDLRVSVLPTYWGEKVVCRLLDNKRAMQPLEAIGFEGAQHRDLMKMVRSPYGLVLVTGPTGSGKSTTLYAALNAVRNPEVNIVTVEDPVEYQIGGINQVQVNPKRGLTFAGALRSILRQDPDVILVGEVRDQETGILAAEAALTGHLVLTSLHTNDALGSITRLLELGVEPYLVAPSLLGVVAQRLVRTACQACRSLREPDPADLEMLGLPSVPEGTVVAHAVGCAVCRGTGYKGRVAIREVLVVDDQLRMLITRGAPADELRAAALAKGFRTMRFHALRLWLQGATTTRELLRVTR